MKDSIVAGCLHPAYRGYARIFLKDLEAVRPSAIIDIIRSGESFVFDQATQRTLKALRTSTRMVVS